MAGQSVGEHERRDISSAVRGSNQSGMRAHNERLVLSLLRQNGPMAKANIARQTGLSAQTISVIMRGLEKDGLLNRGDPIRGRIGQPSVPMHLSPDGAFFLGLKIGRRSVDLMLINFVGDILGRVQLTHPYPTPDGISRFALGATSELRSRLSADQDRRIAGLGIAIPFQIWEWATLIGAPKDKMSEWKVRDIRADLADQLEFPVFLQNDASAACGAELVLGTGERPRDFLHFFVGYFIGGGLVLNNRLYTGRSGNAAAIGSLPISGPGGAHLQLVDVASLSVLEQLLKDANKPTASLWNTPESWEIDEEILSIWLRDACSGMAYAVAAASSVVDIGDVLIDGWLPASLRDRLVRGTDQALQELALSGIEKPVVRPGTIGPDGRSLGAASLPLSERYLVDLGAVLSAG